MLSGGSIQYIVVPMLALAVIGLMVLMLRWSSAHGSSLVERSVQPGDLHQYGMLVAVSAPTNYVDGEVLRQRLEKQGVKATLAMTNDGPRVMVFAKDELRARRVVQGAS